MTDEKPKNGLFTDYYLTVPNQIKLKVNYKDGKEDGKWTEWHKNGQKKREGNFKDGKKIFEGGHKAGKKYLNEVEGLKKSIGEEEAPLVKEAMEFETRAATDKNNNTSNKGTQTVKLSDIDIPFGSMVIFMVKWTIASIPAFLILTVLLAIFAVFFFGILATLQAIF